MSTSAVIHLASGAIGFVTLAAACFVVARAMSRRKQSSMARLSFVCGLGVLIGFFAPVAIPDAGSAGIAGIWIAVVVGWAWLAVVSTRLMRQTRA
jgi:Na+-driven multidrug efflux pump